VVLRNSIILFITLRDSQSSVLKCKVARFYMISKLLIQ
jgi:hypothetical protein